MIKLYGIYIQNKFKKLKDNRRDFKDNLRRDQFANVKSGLF